jgi:putative addiction module antidote
MFQLKLTKIGNSVGVVLPKELLEKLQLALGDSVFVTDAPGGVTFSAYDASVEAQLAEGEAFMRDYRDTFKALAK